MAQGRVIIDGIARYNTANDTTVEYKLLVGNANTGAFSLTDGNTIVQSTVGSGQGNFTNFANHDKTINFTRAGNSLSITFPNLANVEWENQTGSSQTVNRFLIAADRDSNFELLFPLTSFSQGINVPDGAKLRFTNVQLSLLNTAGA